MLIKIQDLKKGDLILFPSNGKFIMMIVLQDPRPDMDENNVQKLTYQKTPKFKNLAVSCRRIVTKTSKTWGSGITAMNYIKTDIQFICTAEDHNYKKYIYPNDRDFWLLERGLPTEFNKEKV